MGFLWDTLEQGVSPPPPVLDAEVRIGELTSMIPKSQGARTDLQLADTAIQKSSQSKPTNPPKPSAPVVKPPIPAPEPPKRQRAGSKSAPGYSISL